MRRRPERSEAGYTLVALMAAATIMLILMAAAVPSWRYVMKNDAEEELLFRGGEIADAIARYQQRNGNALPPSLEVLVKGRYLRKEYKDPMTKDGKWRLIRQGENLGPVRPPGEAGSAGATTGRSALPGTRSPTGTGALPGGAGTATRSSRSGRTGTILGGIQGVASTSEETSLRVFNGRTKYNEWLFLPGQPRVVGRPQGPTGATGTGAPGQPGLSPARPGQTPSGGRPAPGIRR